MKIPALIWGGILLGGLHLQAEVVLNEIVSANSQLGHLAADGVGYDWIELHNTGAEEVDLMGSFLTDDPELPTKWEFTRSFLIPAGGYAIVFASDKDALIDDQEHLNFKLDAGDGEYLGLVASDGVTFRDEFSPQFPPLRPKRSFGIPSDGGKATVLVDVTPNAANSEAGPMPVIHSFTTTAEVIANGESVTITWETENGTWVTLDTSDNNGPNVEASGSTILRPIHHQTVTLRAWNQYAEAKEVITILVGPSVNTFTALPATIATGGQTVLRWDTEGSEQALDLDGFIVTQIKTPTTFIPTNVDLIPVDTTWKQAPETPGDSWQNQEFDDADWLDTSLPFEGKGYFRKSFEVSALESLATGVLRLSTRVSFIATLNGVTIYTSENSFGVPLTDEGDLRINPALLNEGSNVLAVQTTSEFSSYRFQLGAWRSQPTDTIVPVTLKSSNAAGESSKTINITVLAENAPLPPLPTVAITEIFWSYFGTFPIEPYRFYEVQNCGTEPLDLSGIQLIGSSFFSFADANDPTLEAGDFTVVVNHHPAFSEIWPGDRSVVGQVENPEQVDPYTFEFRGALLDPLGRVFEEVTSVTMPEFGDIYQPFERVDPKASSTDPENWFVNQEYGNSQGGGTPGEASFRIIDFSFDPPFASPGDQVTLKWEVSRDATLEISNGIGPVTGPSGSIDLIVPEDAREFRFWLTTQTTFTEYDRLAQLTLPPSMSFFDVSKTSIIPGEEVTFRWTQRTPYLSSGGSISPEVPPGVYGSRYTFTPLISGFDQGGRWRARAHPSEPEPEWKTADFDVSWRTRTGVLGYGDDRITSPFPTSNWLTAYFYHIFHVSEVDEINGLFLDILNDGGIEIHLNGQEVIRENLPGGELNQLTPSLSKIDAGERSFEIPSSLLVEGQNIIAIAVHKNAIDDEKLIFDLGLRAQRPIPPSGKKTYTFTASNVAGSDSAQVTILFQEPLELSAWQAANGLLGDADRTDTDGDGLSDFLEFMTGSDPGSENPHPITLTRDEEGFISVSHPHNLAAGNNTLSLQSSPDLKTWKRLLDFKFEGSVTPDDSKIADVRYRSYAPIREARYFRLYAN